MSSPAVVLGLGVVMASGYVAMGQWPLVAESPAVFVLLYGLEFGAFLLAVRCFRDVRLTAWSRLAILFGLAVLLRSALLFSDPLFDNDLYRYRWDGKVLGHGVNPYRYSPDAEELDWLRDELDENVEYAYIPTVYPPLSQSVFWLGWRASPNTLLGLKGVVLTFDLLTLGIVVLLLRAVRLPMSNAAFYAWHPLILKEFANSGHQDAIGILLVMVFALSLVRGKQGAAAVALALSALTKLAPLTYLPLALGRLRARYFVATIGLTVLAYVPFVGAATGIGEGLSTFARYWESNACVFALLRAALSSHVSNPFACAQIGVAAFGAVAMVLAARWAWRSRDAGCPDDPLRAMAALTLALLLLSPFVAPWYVCWLVPLLCFVRFPAGVVLSGTVGLSYLYYLGEQERGWVLVLEYAPVLALLAWQWWTRRPGYCKAPPQLDPAPAVHP